MSQTNEPHVKKSSCSYCGDAPISHTLSFLESFIAVPLDNHTKKIIKYVPNFVKKFVDFIPEFLFKTLAFLKLVKFSSDIEKANNFRSKIIWEEARRIRIIMQQVIFFGKPLDYYRAMLKIKDQRRVISMNSRE